MQKLNFAHTRILMCSQQRCWRPGWCVVTLTVFQTRAHVTQLHQCIVGSVSASTDKSVGGCRQVHNFISAARSRGDMSVVGHWVPEHGRRPHPSAAVLSALCSDTDVCLLVSICVSISIIIIICVSSWFSHSLCQYSHRWEYNIHRCLSVCLSLLTPIDSKKLLKAHLFHIAFWHLLAPLDNL